MTTTYVGHTPVTTTDHRPHPESTDSEFNLLQQGYANQRDRIAELEAENANLKAHIDADHEALQRMAGWSASRTALASDDGPEVVYDWSQDEDAVEYNFPSTPPPDDESSLYHLARLAYRQ